MFGILLAVVSAVILFTYIEIAFIPAHFYKDKNKKITLARLNLRKISFGFLKVLGVKVNVVIKDKEAIKNLNRDEKLIFMANHQSNFDIPIILSSINMDLGFVAKKEMETWPFFSRWMKRGNYIFLDRNNPREGMKSIKKAVEIVNAGYPTVIFPEGERTSDGNIGTFKKGSFKLALDTNGIIIPMTIIGAMNIQRKGKVAIHRNQNVTLVIDTPIDVSKLSDEEKKNLNTKIRGIILKNYEN